MKTINKAHNFVNLFFPTIVLGAITGILTSVIVNLFKFAAKYIIHFSENIYSMIDSHLWIIGVSVCVFIAVAWLMEYVYKKEPNVKGGGIPTSIAAIRGIIKIKWLQNLLGVFSLSLISFFLGVPLGNEGPSVQMGCAVGGGVSKICSKKHKAWERYSMTGGACAGFSVATGAPISGVVFAIEEAHRRISPMILIVAASSVMFAGLTTELLAPFLGVSKSLFPVMELPVLGIKEAYIPLLVGLAVGVFAVIFLKLYRLLDKVYNKKLAGVPSKYKIFVVLLLTFICGIISLDFVSTGHELVLHLFEHSQPITWLILVLCIRTLLTLSANTNGITGGTFVPLLALGAVVSAMVARIAIINFGIDDKYYYMIIVFGLISCISAMMKMPLTAVVFAVEALGCYENIVYVILVTIISYLLTEIFSVLSINDVVVEKREEAMYCGGEVNTYEETVVVRKKSFAVGREISDIFWPHGLIVVSVQHEAAHGGNVLQCGDVLSIRYKTNNKAGLIGEIESIVGEQNKI